MSHAHLISPHTFKLAGFAAKAKPRSERSRPRDEAPAKTQPRFFFLRLLILAKPPMQKKPPGEISQPLSAFRLEGNGKQIFHSAGWRDRGKHASIDPVAWPGLAGPLGSGGLLSLRVFFGINLLVKRSGDLKLFSLGFFGRNPKLEIT
jgi:hypothetical protein